METRETIHELTKLAYALVAYCAWWEVKLIADKLQSEYGIEITGVHASKIENNVRKVSSKGTIYFKGYPCHISVSYNYDTLSDEMLAHRDNIRELTNCEWLIQSEFRQIDPVSNWRPDDVPSRPSIKRNISITIENKTKTSLLKQLDTLKQIIEAEFAESED
jgi:hypothetical protein